MGMVLVAVNDRLEIGVGRIDSQIVLFLFIGNTFPSIIFEVIEFEYLRSLPGVLIDIAL